MQSMLLNIQWRKRDGNGVAAIRGGVAINSVAKPHHGRGRRLASTLKRI